MHPSFLHTGYPLPDASCKEGSHTSPRVHWSASIHSRPLFRPFCYIFSLPTHCSHPHLITVHQHAIHISFTISYSTIVHCALHSSSFFLRTVDGYISLRFLHCLSGPLSNLKSIIHSTTAHHVLSSRRALQRLQMPILPSQHRSMPFPRTTRPWCHREDSARGLRVLPAYQSPRGIWSIKCWCSSRLGIWQRCATLKAITIAHLRRRWTWPLHVPSPESPIWTPRLLQLSTVYFCIHDTFI